MKPMTMLMEYEHRNKQFSCNEECKAILALKNHSMIPCRAHDS